MLKRSVRLLQAPLSTRALENKMLI